MSDHAKRLAEIKALAPHEMGLLAPFIKGAPPYAWHPCACVAPPVCTGGRMIVMGKGRWVMYESEPMTADEAERIVRLNRERWPAWGSWWTRWA